MQVIVNGADISASYTAAELEGIGVELIAFDGETGQGSLPHPDAAGSGEWYAGQSCKIQDGSGPTVIVDGFIGDQDRERGEAPKTRRLETFHTEDPNARLGGHRAIVWVRPSETDRARVLAFAAAYVPTLSTTQVLNTNLATLPAKTYTTEDLFPELLADVREATGKTIYVVDGDLHSHLTSEGPSCTIALTDGTADYSTTWPVYDPHRTKDKGELFNDVTARNQGGSTANAQDATSISRHDSGGLVHQALLDLADVPTASLAGLAAAHLAQHKDERKSYEVTTGPFTAAQTALVKPGMLIVATSQAIGLSAATERIGRMKWQYKHPSTWWAVLELSHPLRVRTTGRPKHGVPPDSAAALTTGACVSGVSHFVRRQDDGAGTYTESLGGAGSGLYVGSWVYYNVPYTDSVFPCPVGGGSWRGYNDEEFWIQFTAPADAPTSYLGMQIVLDLTALTTSGTVLGYSVRLAQGAAAANRYGEGTTIAAGPTAGTATIYIPRSVIAWGAINCIVLHPDWLCDRMVQFCNAAASFGSPVADGRANSGRYSGFGFGDVCVVQFASGTTGIAAGVAGVGAVDGVNRTYTLIGWDGTGGVEATINGLAEGAASLTLDTSAKTVTFNTAPPSGTLPLFTYRVAA